MNYTGFKIHRDVELNAYTSSKNQYLIEAMSREYLHFTIASKILERTMELDKTILDSRLSRLISLTNITQKSRPSLRI